MVAFFSPILPYVVPTTMIDVIKHLGLQSSLVLTLDGGDAASYDGSSQTVSDVSGAGNHYYRGATSGSDATDPTFSGVAGRQSSGEYFSSDGGDYCTPTAAHTFAGGWHKDNATFTVAAWVWVPAGVASPPGYPIITTRGTPSGTTAIGVSVQIGGLASTGRITLNYGNGATIAGLVPPTNDVIVEGAWMFAALSFGEGSGASFVQANGFSELLSSDTYSSPSASASSGQPTIWATELFTPVVAPNGARLNSIMAWNRALSQAEVASLYDATKAKFGY